MHASSFRTPALLVVLAIAGAQVRGAEVQEFHNDQAGWEAAAGGRVTTIDFSGFEHGTFITDQYIDLGIHFHNLNVIIYPHCGWFVNCSGIQAVFGLSVTFDEPQYAIGVQGGVIELWNQDQLVYTSSHMPGAFEDPFAGLVSPIPFDEAFAYGLGFTNGTLLIDELHFASLPAGDLTGDGTVGVDDLLILIAQWGSCPDRERKPGTTENCPADLNGDGVVDVDDLLILLSNWTE